MTSIERTASFRRQLEDRLRVAAAAADAGYPDNESLVIDPATGRAFRAAR